MIPAKHFYYFSKFIGMEWEKFGSFLEVTKMELQNIESSKSIPVLEKPFQMLCVWFRKQENGSWELFMDQLKEYGNLTWISEANSITEMLKQISILLPVSENIGAMKDCCLKDYHMFLSELLSKRWYVFGVEMQLNLIELDEIRKNNKSYTDCSFEMLYKWGNKTQDTSCRECRKQLICNKEWNSVIGIMDSYIIEGNDGYLRSQTQLDFYEYISQHLNVELTTLSKHLEIDYIQLKLIYQSFPTPKRKYFEILQFWDNQQYNAPKLDDFKIIFEKIGKKNLIKTAEEFFEKQRTSSEYSLENTAFTNNNDLVRSISSMYSSFNIARSSYRDLQQSTTSVYSLENTARTNKINLEGSTSSLYRFENASRTYDNDVGFTKQAGSPTADNYYDNVDETVKPLSTASSKFYSMENKCSGICLIFITDSNELNVVNQKDEKILRKTFSFLRFQVIVKKNKSSEEILKIIQKKGLKHDIYDCFVVCVLCRNQDYIVEKKSVLQKDNMASKVVNLTCLQNKPKLFFIQTWETESIQPNPNQHSIYKPFMLDQNVWKDKDIFFSIAQGNLLNSKPTHGSWYVKNLCEILVENATTSSFVGMLSMLDDKFRSDCKSSHVNEISEMNLQLKFKVKKKAAL